MTPNQRRAFTAYKESPLPYGVRAGLLEFHLGTSYFKTMTEDDAIFACIILNNPLRHLEAWGRETGKCMMCNRTLTDPESIARGIGPECASKIKGNPT